MSNQKCLRAKDLKVIVIGDKSVGEGESIKDALVNASIAAPSNNYCVYLTDNLAYVDRTCNLVNVSFSQFLFRCDKAFNILKPGAGNRTKILMGE